MGAWGVKALECDEVSDDDGIREMVELWKNEDSGEINPAWLEHLDWLMKRLVSE